MSHNILLTKSFDAAGALLANSIVKVGAADYQVLQAGAATDPLLGITTEINANAGERADVAMIGIADLKLGGTVAAGDFICANYAGYGVTAAPAAGANNTVVGTAIIAGVTGDIIPVLINPFTLQG
jgi:hypothetical protein